MFCPLCHAEYREGFTTCKDCKVSLVDGTFAAPEGQPLHSDELETLWQGNDPYLKDEISRLLEAREIPYDVIDSRTLDSDPMLLRCLFFQIRVPAALMRYGEEVLRQAQEIERGAAAEYDYQLAPKPICPLCGDDYDVGYTECADCKIPLVVAPTRDEIRSIAIWEGSDPRPFKEECRLLREAGISFTTKIPKAWIGMQPGDVSRHVIRVLAQDLPRVERAYQAEAVPDAEDDATIPVIPESEAFAEDFTPASRLFDEDLWDGRQATSEVWSGMELGFAENLRDCLRENGIGSRLVTRLHEPNRLLVYPADEAHARKIVQQILDATPS